MPWERRDLRGSYSCSFSFEVRCPDRLSVAVHRGNIRRSAPRRYAHNFRTGGCSLSVLRNAIRMPQRDGERRSILIFWRARQELNARTSRRKFLEEVVTLK